MEELHPRIRRSALTMKVFGFGVGLLSVGVALVFAFDEVTHFVATGGLGIGDVVSVLAMSALALAGTALIAQLPESLRARFRRTPTVGRHRPVYGFGTMVAVGVGATLGSPLFILIPLNIEQYAVVSLLSLFLATVLSIAMAKIYADLGKESKLLGAELVGGPSFARLASGATSVRYFISRLSMWVANTALAAYSKIVFIIFDFVFMPQVLAGYGPFVSTSVTWAIAIGFVAWTLLNIFFEQRYLRQLGAIQIVLTLLLVIMMVYHAEVLGATGGWNLSGLFVFPGGSAWLPALVINTGYLYLLFFGFQEIQVFERDSVERSSVPILSALRKGFTLSKTEYFEAAMILSVVIAAAVNVLYALAVFSAAHNAPDLQTSCSTSACIPALYLAQKLLGGGQEVLIALAFLIATVTTFVPAFLAAARHLSALGEDGYMPARLASLSWLFTLVAVFLLAIGDQNFLVNITDVMVLVSLGIIALAGVWLRRYNSRATGSKYLSLGVGLSCFVFGGAIYFGPGGGEVVVFGSVAILFAYLLFDVIELGSLGAQLFLSVFCFVCAGALSVFDHTIYVSEVILDATKFWGTDPSGILAWGLIVCSVFLGINVVLDVSVLGRTPVT